MLSTTERDYGAEHQAERRRLQQQMDGGAVFGCASTDCLLPGVPIDKDTLWDLGHTRDRTAWTGPEHRVCNRTEGARRSHQSAGGMTIRTW